MTQAELRIATESNMTTRAFIRNAVVATFLTLTLKPLVAQEATSHPAGATSGPLDIIPKAIPTVSSDAKRPVKKNKDLLHREAKPSTPSKKPNAPKDNSKIKLKPADPKKTRRETVMPSREVPPEPQTNAKTSPSVHHPGPESAKEVAVKTTNSPSIADQYCEVVVPQAAQAILDAQRATLEQLKVDIEKRFDHLRHKAKLVEEAEERQKSINQRATKDLIAILSKMRPDAAASQLAIMDELLSASLLSRMEPRVASAILNEMVPTKAARMADNMSGKPNGGP